MEHWVDIGQILSRHCILYLIKLTFRFSYPKYNSLVFLSNIRLSGFLIQDKNLTECMAKKKKKNKAHTKTAPEFAVNNFRKNLPRN